MSSHDHHRKTKSMNSTQHMSYTQSYTTTFYLSARKSHNHTILNYAHIPMLKDPPRWNQSAATWRHSSRKHSFTKDIRFKENSLYYTDII